MSERKPKHTVRLASFVVVYEGDEILLHRRCNTGYHDGEYDVPSGHVEEDEMPNVAASREVLEEVGLVVNPADLELYHINTNETETPEAPYLNLLFRVPLSKCIGTPTIMEPDKCDDLSMFSTITLPVITNTVRLAVQHFGDKTVSFSQIMVK